MWISECMEQTVLHHSTNFGLSLKNANCRNTEHEFMKGE